LLNGKSSGEERPRRQPIRKLKPGPGLSPHVVVADQRRRLRAAMIDLVAERGYERVTVRALAKHAGVSTRTFYRHFANGDDCLGFTCESTLECALRRMEEASSDGLDWEHGLRLAVASMMRDFGRQPEAATVALVEAFAGGPAVVARTDAMTGTIAALLSDLIGAAPDPAAAPRRLVSGMVAGALRIASATAMAGRAHELPRLAPAVSDWMLSLVSSPVESGLGGPAYGGSNGSARREGKPFPDGGRLGNGVLIGDERERILRATVRLAAARGLPGLTIPRIRGTAGVSRRAFDSHFASLTECFLDALEWLVTAAAARARAWTEHDADWQRRTAKFMLALCAQAARNGALASLVFAGILDAGRDGLVRRERFVAAGAAGIQGDLAPLSTVSPVALEASVAAAWQIAHAEAMPGKVERLPGLAPLLTHTILAPVQSGIETPAKR
jgi:AcrR family transcriptional regulator